MTTLMDFLYMIQKVLSLDCKHNCNLQEQASHIDKGVTHSSYIDKGVMHYPKLPQNLEHEYSIEFIIYFAYVKFRED